MLNRRTINKQVKALLFPKFSEIQYFALVAGVVMLVVLSPVVQSEASALLKNTAPEYFIYLAFFSLYLFVLFILPVLLAIVMVSKLRLSPRFSYLACSFYYAIYCILAACSIGPQLDLLHGSSNMLLTANFALSAVILGVLIARYFM